ncbi:hypothetical protein TKK_0018123 [Trichogramma kaykai]|uniref:Lipase n=1 Tax=Trichogramma kaykai TaxID=54128 RepID=A0ABD2VZW8_9HYME
MRFECVRCSKHVFSWTLPVLLLALLSPGKCDFPSFNEVVDAFQLIWQSSHDDATARPPTFKSLSKATDNPDVDLTTPEMIRREGYSSEAHVIMTEDGYLLTMHRIPGRGPAVFLQHGLLASSSDWVIPGKNKGLAFILSDLGYDVWMGNARGNTYSHGHVNYTTHDLRYWDFSWQEMAKYDLPAEINYIVRIKNASLMYIGHSMGTTMFYAMAIDRPDVAKSVKAMFSLAPIAFMNHLKSPVRILSYYLSEIQWIIRVLGEGEFLPQNWLLKFFARHGCDVNVSEEKICANTLFLICGFDASQFNYTLLPVILSHSPAGASTKTLIHYGQEIKSGNFQRYDYGKNKNLQIYNSTVPPQYDLSKVQVPVGIFWSENDWLASPIDVQRLYKSLPNKIINYKVDYPKFNHLDFLWAVDAPKLVYKKLVATMEEFRNL